MNLSQLAHLPTSDALDLLSDEESTDKVEGFYFRPTPKVKPHPKKQSIEQQPYEH